ncbi:hypothetical protein K7X08_036207 [Anisodus acutangulus]|uniref:40S ribosomal protein S8 n=1 Tax=Anisodus acutangulus TaxID=402998 RepID=A0A9Q1L7V1_9SOLA|nr:hypothetical protein K7X08_036207 [Anisodus acutangulus]
MADRQKNRDSGGVHHVRTKFKDGYNEQQISVDPNFNPAPYGVECYGADLKIHTHPYGFECISAIICISRDSKHKKRATSGKRKAWRKKRKYELGRQPDNTKLSSNKIVRRVRVGGGNAKWNAIVQIGVAAEELQYGNTLMDVDDEHEDNSEIKEDQVFDDCPHPKAIANQLVSTSSSSEKNLESDADKVFDISSQQNETGVDELQPVTRDEEEEDNEYQMLDQILQIYVLKSGTDDIFQMLHAIVSNDVSLLHLLHYLWTLIKMGGVLLYLTEIARVAKMKLSKVDEFNSPDVATGDTQLGAYWKVHIREGSTMETLPAHFLGDEIMLTLWNPCVQSLEAHKSAPECDKNTCAIISPYFTKKGLSLARDKLDQFGNFFYLPYINIRRTNGCIGVTISTSDQLAEMIIRVGLFLFEVMDKHYGIKSLLVLFIVMVYLLRGAGHLEEAPDLSVELYSIKLPTVRWTKTFSVGKGFGKSEPMKQGVFKDEMVPDTLSNKYIEATEQNGISLMKEAFSDTVKVLVGREEHECGMIFYSPIVTTEAKCEMLMFKGEPHKFYLRSKGRSYEKSRSKLHSPLFSESKRTSGFDMASPVATVFSSGAAQVRGPSDASQSVPRKIQDIF